MGRARVAALLRAAAEVFAERGYQAATMAEIAARAGAQVGSLYRFFPSKPILADALILKLADQVDEGFAAFARAAPGMSLDALSRALVDWVVDLNAESRAVLALLETGADASSRRQALRETANHGVTRVLLARRPRLDPSMAESMAMVLVQIMKLRAGLPRDQVGEPLDRACEELHAMARLYLADRLGVET